MCCARCECGCLDVFVFVLDNQSRKMSFALYESLPIYCWSSQDASITLPGTSSTTETASAVVVVEVDELVVLAGDMLSALLDDDTRQMMGGGDVATAVAAGAAIAVVVGDSWQWLGGSTKLFPPSWSHLRPVSDDGVQRSNSMPESGETPVALANWAIKPPVCMHLQSAAMQLQENLLPRPQRAATRLGLADSVVADEQPAAGPPLPSISSIACGSHDNPCNWLSKDSNCCIKWKFGDTSGLRLRTSVKASFKLSARVCIRYARVTVTERDTPARQWTSTAEFAERASSVPKNIKERPQLSIIIYKTTFIIKTHLWSV